MTAQLRSRGTGQAGHPTWWASWMVRSATLPLPAGHRARYRQEFLAELYGMSPAKCGAQQDRGSMGPPNTIGA